MPEKKYILYIIYVMCIYIYIYCILLCKFQHSLEFDLIKMCVYSTYLLELEKEMWTVGYNLRAGERKMKVAAQNS